MPENDKTDTEEEYLSLHCVQGGQNGGRKKSDTCQEIINITVKSDGGDYLSYFLL